MVQSLSVIVPIGPGERTWRDLLPDLRQIPDGSEILLAAVEPCPADLNEAVRQANVTAPVRWILTERGRARQMNAAACAASGERLWFLHADSRLPPRTIDALLQAFSASPDALHYFHLSFHDGPWLMRLTEWGIRLRNRLFRIPFGDQGFAVRRVVFEQLGRYDENTPYGEDHLLVWSAHRNGILVRCTGAAIATSGRKYRERGWWRTTFRHLWLTWKQAYPQWRIAQSSRRRTGQSRSS